MGNMWCFGVVSSHHICSLSLVYKQVVFSKCEDDPICNSLQTGGGLACLRVAHPHLERRAHAVEPGPVRDREDARPRHPVCRRACGSCGGLAQNADHRGNRSRAPLPHELGQVRVPAWLSDAAQAGAGVQDGRPHPSSCPGPAQDRRHPYRTGAGTPKRLLRYRDP